VCCWCGYRGCGWICGTYSGSTCGRARPRLAGDAAPPPPLAMWSRSASCFTFSGCNVQTRKCRKSVVGADRNHPRSCSVNSLDHTTNSENGSVYGLVARTLFLDLSTILQNWWDALLITGLERCNVSIKTSNTVDFRLVLANESIGSLGGISWVIVKVRPPPPSRQRFRIFRHGCGESGSGILSNRGL
jgi:hypothetical protein